MLYLRDFVTFNEKPRIFSDALNLLEDSAIGATPGMGVVADIRATHSGYLLNRRVYPGTNMKRSVDTWCSPEHGGSAAYDKPILVHHRAQDGGPFGGGSEACDPIGRVVGATYTQLSDDTDFVNDWKRPATSHDDLGSGYIMLKAMITDPDAAAKVLDRRYDTVSTGQRTDSARCSICGNDWLNDSQDDDDECEHVPGKSYEANDTTYLCYMVSGNLTYDECSYVNLPAQPNARNLNVSYCALTEAKQGNGSADRPLITMQTQGAYDSLSLSDGDNSVSLLIPDGGHDVIPDEAVKLLKKRMYAISPAYNTKSNVKENIKTTSKADQRISESRQDASQSDDTGGQDSSGVQTTKGTEDPVSMDEHVDYDQFALMHIAKTIMDNNLLDDREDCDCEFMSDDIRDFAAEYAMTEAKLSTAQRKKLKSSTFCGPGRSFPVPDYAHVTAARRLLGRAKLSSEAKSRVRACVERKSEKLGCSSTEDGLITKEKVMSEETAITEEVETEEVIDTSEEKSETVMVETSALNDALATVTQAKKDLEEKHGKLQSTLDTKVKLCEKLTEENAELKASMVRSAATQLAISRINLGKPGTVGIDSRKKFSGYVEDLCKRTLDSLTDANADLVPELDMLARNKSSARSSLLLDKKVENPVENRDESERTPDSMGSDKAPKTKAEVLDQL